MIMIAVSSRVQRVQQLLRAGTFHERSQYFLQLWICGIGEVVKFTPLGLAFNINGPSLTNTQVPCTQLKRPAVQQMVSRGTDGSNCKGLPSRDLH